ncbi:putative peroxisomal membrane protein receptor Pex19 [Aspergillus saccharolyticus JOP 1030-1]|uniref:Pex19-domain-containing protein n=1 Tax=Aspergillus saccharolyticus JOP 1030-1 TaxID=1450539 RepID=A0A318Z4J0_9EURO|nr:Pex19-domain-containing protein [Aspergillus saccharolyticus JOP 1030-1]PYH41344.1 Pex19-domain-containing protein [Aspergillus saccharolyticus JOP 1030-1]
MSSSNPNPPASQSEHVTSPATNNPSTNPAESESRSATTATNTTTPQRPQPAQVDDEDSDFDELDDVLDNFNKPPPASAPAQTTDAPTEDVDLDEEAFLRQLEKDMASLMGAGGSGADNTTTTGASAGIPDGLGDGEEALEKDAEMFAKYLEESGVSAEDLLKQLVGDLIKGGGDGGAADNGKKDAGGGGSSKAQGGKKKSKSKKKTGGDGDAAAAGEASGSTVKTTASAAAAAAATTPETFNDTIQRTIERMKESGDKATAAAEEEDADADDLVAQLIKAIEAGGAGGDGNEADLTKMFMGMMEQLSNKEILYEPMKELDAKFGPWIAENKASGKVSGDELARYEKQAGVVAQIVAKFEEKGYTDEDPKCREYVWEKMQEMQGCGNPPDELISAPMMEDLMGGGGGAGAPDCPQQ